MAHEIAHLHLHKPFFKWLAEQQFSTREQWLQEVVAQSETLMLTSSFEGTANEFAGRLLVPRTHLEIEVNNALKDVLKKAKDARLDLREASDDSVRAHLGSLIHRRFQVSAEVAKYRIQNENLYPPDR